jgi:hypothetical protein
MRHCSGLMLCDCSTSYEDEIRRVLYVATCLFNNLVDEGLDFL